MLPPSHTLACEAEAWRRPERTLRLTQGRLAASRSCSNRRAFRLRPANGTTADGLWPPSLCT